MIKFVITTSHEQGPTAALPLLTNCLRLDTINSTSYWTNHLSLEQKGRGEKREKSSHEIYESFRGRARESLVGK